MSDYLGRLGERHLNRASAIRPQPVSKYEPLSADLQVLPEPVEAEVKHVAPARLAARKAQLSTGETAREAFVSAEEASPDTLPSTHPAPRHLHESARSQSFQPASPSAGPAAPESMMAPQNWRRANQDFGSSVGRGEVIAPLTAAMPGPSEQSEALHSAPATVVGRAAGGSHAENQALREPARQDAQLPEPSDHHDFEHTAGAPLWRKPLTTSLRPEQIDPARSTPRSRTMPTTSGTGIAGASARAPITRGSVRVTVAAAIAPDRSSFEPTLAQQERSARGITVAAVMAPEHGLESISPVDRPVSLEHRAMVREQTRREPEAERIVEISIGEIDVRSTPPPPQPHAAPHRDRTVRPPMSLDDYLRRRSGSSGR
jgi:hypothetical protein